MRAAAPGPPAAPATWLLVRMSPSGATTTPEPDPPRDLSARTAKPTTAGPTRSTTSITARE